MSPLSASGRPMRGATPAHAVLAATLAALAVGCASTGARPGVDPFATDRESSVRIIVQNRNFSDARLYAIRRGSRTVLGTVGGKQDAEFRLEWLVPEPLQIEINMLAGPQCFTREMEVDPGDIVELQIAIEFPRSAACR